MVHDVRLAIRVLAKRPLFAALAVCTLALGIGAATAVFSLVQGVLLTAPPYRDPDHLVLIPSVHVDSQHVERLGGTAAAEWTDWQQHATALDGVAAYTWSFNFLIDPQGSESIEGMVVTPEYFSLLGVQPMLGRTFTSTEAAANTKVIVLGYDFWKRRFNGDPGILGQTIRVSRLDAPPVVVGVMPPGVRFLPSPAAADEPSYNVNAPVDFWMPAAPDPKTLYQPFWDVVARLKANATSEKAAAELAVLAPRETAGHPDLANQQPRVERLLTETNRQGQRILLPLLGASVLVLLIACGNTAALLIVRGLQRQQEYAVRSALGSGRAALFRQASAESVILALAGGLVGAVLAVETVRVFKTIGGVAIPRLDAVTIGWRLLVTGVAAALAAAVLAGLFPALRASRLAPVEALKRAGPRSSSGRADRRLLRIISVAQTALTIALLVGAGLMLKTMERIATVTTGYSIDHILVMTVTAVQGDGMDFHRRALERLAQVPGVQAAAFAWGTPLTGNDWPDAVEIEGHPVATPADRVSVPLRSVTSGYFALLGLPILDGRDFRANDDRAAPPVAVVNRTLAERYFGTTSSALGKRLWLRGRSQPATQIIGVAADARTNDLTLTPSPEIYLSFWQSTPFSKDLVVRTSGDPRAVIAGVRGELRAIDPTVAAEHIRTLDDVRVDSLASRLFTMRLLVGFAAIATLLTAIGIYGVLALSVAARQREIAIRVAIGAHRRSIQGLVFGEALRLAAGGIVVGLACAVIGARALHSFLFDVTPTDPTMLAGVALLFAVVTVLASLTPAYRATRVDPMEALRAD